MKLYYTPGACSLAAHIGAKEAAFDIDLIKVDLASKKTEEGADFKAINVKGYIPFLELDSGESLSENQVILQYLADQKPQTHLIADFGTLERYRTLEWLAYISTELHKGFGPLWNRSIPEEIKKMALERLSDRFDYVESQLIGKSYLQGDGFCIADAYLFTVMNWAHYFKIDLTPWPNLVEYQQRVGGRPAVTAALNEEGLSA